MQRSPARSLTRALTGRWLVAAVLAAVVAVACGGTGPDARTSGGSTPAAPAGGSSPASPPPTTDPGTGEAAAANAGALRFTAPALSGGTIRGAELAGRDVVLWMWAPW